MTNSLDNFVNFIYESRTIRLAKKRQIFWMNTKGYNDIVLNMNFSNGESIPVLFNNIIYVPSLTNNLILTITLENQEFEALVTPYRGEQLDIFKNGIRVAYIIKVDRHIVIHTTRMQLNALPQLQEHSVHATSSAKLSARL